MTFDEYLKEYDDVLFERKDDFKFRHILYQILQIIKDSYKQNKENPKKIETVFSLPFSIYIVSSSDNFLGKTTIYHSENIVIWLNVHEKYKDLLIKEDFLTIIQNMEDTLIHELTHYFNYNQIKNKKFELGSPPDHKHPFEFNSYYVELASKFDKAVYNLVKSNQSFESVFGEHAQDFINIAFNELSNIRADLVPQIRNNPTYYKKWVKRLFQLYFESKELYQKLK